MIEHTDSERQLFSAFEARVGFEVVSKSSTEGQLRLMGRVPSQRMGDWLIIIQRLLGSSEEADWNIDISKQYFLRGGKILYGWRLIVQANEVVNHLEEIVALVTSSPRSKKEITEIALTGAGVHRTTLKRGKGAQSVLNASVGPLAAMKGM
jgi:hypothetical protein